jgi:hypothetical protein
LLEFKSGGFQVDGQRQMANWTVKLMTVWEELNVEHINKELRYSQPWFRGIVWYILDQRCDDIPIEWHLQRYRCKAGKPLLPLLHQ